MRAVAIATASLVLALACESASVDRSAGGPVTPGRASGSDEAFARLQAYEDERRAKLGPDTLQPWSQRAGDDPWAIVALTGERAAGVLQGADAVVLLDAGGHELARASTPPRPTAVVRDGDALWIAGLAGELARVPVTPEGFGAVAVVEAVGAAVIRDAVAGPGGPVLADGYRGELRRFDAATGGATTVGGCPGAIAVAAAPSLLGAACLFDRGLRLRTDDGAQAQVQHDGPLWSLAAIAGDDGWWIAAGGVEDHALDRSDGSFGYVDSFLYLLHATRCAGPGGLCTRRVAAIDVGPWGVVLPKWVGLERVGDDVEVTVTGYGGDAFARVRIGLDGGVSASPVVTRVPPGIRDVARMAEGWLAADPLLDRWVVVGDDGHVDTVASADPRPGAETSVRVGEALFFSHIMAPHASSDGHRSRFTCETCHFEGGVDGRVHYTGRADVHASTKSLLGLFVNRPHFSRALDRTLATMVDNEFAVANRGSAQGPSFALSPDDHPWLRTLGATEVLDAEALRRALVDFLVAFDHETAPEVVALLREARRSGDAPRFTAQERAGAAVFEQHCEGCHQARTVADDATTRVAPAQWEAQVLSTRGPLVWASDARLRTGIEPYVHPEGARVTSLRRLWIKRPYFTNGSAATLADVLARVRLRPSFSHAGGTAPGDRDDPRASLTADERAALAAFLALL